MPICTKKEFDTKSDAETYVWKKRVINPLGNNNFKVIRTYECPICGKYHLTSQPLKSTTNPSSN